MPFSRPLLGDLITRVQADIQSRLPGTEPALRNSLTGILARAQAGSAHGLYGALAWLATNLLPNTQDPALLAEWAAIYNVPQLQAVVAGGQVAFAGAGSVPAGTLLSGPGNLQYTVTSAITVPGSGAVTAVVAGSAGNLAAGITLTLVTPIAGVTSNAIVGSAGITGGADIETISAWSARLLQRIQNPPQGGSATDYTAWARAAHPAITNVWVLPTTPQPGQVTVYVMAYGETANGIPDAGTLSTATTYISSVQPVAAQVFVVAPTPKTINLTVQLSPNTPAVQAAVKASLADLFQREAVPSTTIPLSHLDEAIAESAGEYDHVIVGLTQADLTPDTGYILLLGVVTFEDMPA